MAPDDLAALQSWADRIDNGAADSEESRALVVFNFSRRPASGVAVFHASMSFPANRSLPPIIVRDMNGREAPSAVTGITVGADRTGRLGRCHLEFALEFAVRDIPAQGWRTYIAAYSPGAAPTRLEAVAAMPDARVIETRRHAGDLPATGTF